MRRPASFKGSNTGLPSRHQPSRRFSGWDQPGGRQNNEKVHNVESTDLQTKYHGHSDRLSTRMLAGQSRIPVLSLSIRP